MSDPACKDLKFELYLLRMWDGYGISEIRKDGSRIRSCSEVRGVSVGEELYLDTGGAQFAGLVDGGPPAGVHGMIAEKEKALKAAKKAKRRKGGLGLAHKYQTAY